MRRAINLFFYAIALSLIALHLSFAIGSISGTVYYRGPKDGDIYIGAYTNPQFQGSPAYWTVISDTGSYTFNDVVDDTYWLAAFMDADSNNQFADSIDPHDYRYDSCMVQSDSVTGIDLLLDYFYGTLLYLHFYAIKLSPSIQSAWPGTEDYLCYLQIYVDHKWGPEYIGSVWTDCPDIEGWAGLMYDDGLHWDSTISDSIFGHYEVKDSAAMHIWAGEVPYWSIRAQVDYTPWPFSQGMWLTLAPFFNASSIPVLINPAHNDTIANLQPEFSWHSNGASWYEVIIWDTMPMPSILGEHIVWRAETSSDTVLSMSGSSTYLEQGKSYYWALISYSDTLDGLSAMEWASFTADTSYQVIEEFALTDYQNLQLLQISPNPFIQTTEIRYQITDGRYGLTDSRIELRIYDIGGRLIRRFDDKTLRLCDQIIWDGTSDNGKKVSSGIYFCKLETAGFSRIEKLILLR